MKGVPVIIVETGISGPTIIFQSDGGEENIVVERQQTCSEIYSLSGVLLI